MTNRRILILAYDFPPYNSVGGQRPFSWFKYFPKFGWSPIVVTRHWEGIQYGTADNIVKNTAQEMTIETLENGILIRAPFKQNLRDKMIRNYGNQFGFIRQFLTIFYNLVDLAFLFFDSKRAIYDAARAYLQTNKVDCIIATGEPFILFKYASKLSEEFEIPWNADYRDDWIGNHVKMQSKNPLVKFVNKIESIYELKYLKNASSFTTVNDSIAQNIAQRTGIHRYAIIENGADIDTVNAVNCNGYPENFVITYTGIMYDFNYFEDFAKGFEIFINSSTQKDKIKVCLVGIDAYQNQAVRAAYQLKKQFPNHVEIIGNVSLEEAVRYQKKSSVLLNLIPADPAKGMLSAKASIYAAVKRPILSIPLIKNKETPFFQDRDVHTIAISPEEVTAFLNKRFEIFAKKENLDTDITDDEIFLFSRECKAKFLVEFLNGIIK